MDQLNKTYGKRSIMPGYHFIHHTSLPLAASEFQLLNLHPTLFTPLPRHARLWVQHTSAPLMLMLIISTLDFLPKLSI
jgi:hypothetical protein